MDKIQKILVEAGRKDLAQLYYEKISAKFKYHKVTDEIHFPSLDKANQFVDEIEETYPNFTFIDEPEEKEIGKFFVQVFGEEFKDSKDLKKVKDLSRKYNGKWIVVSHTSQNIGSHERKVYKKSQNKDDIQVEIDYFESMIKRDPASAQVRSWKARIKELEKQLSQKTSATHRHLRSLPRIKLVLNKLQDLQSKAENFGISLDEILEEEIGQELTMSALSSSDIEKYDDISAKAAKKLMEFSGMLSLMVSTLSKIK